MKGDEEREKKVGLIGGGERRGDKGLWKIDVP